MTSLPSLMAEALSSPQCLQYMSWEMLVWEDVKGSPGLLNESVREGFWIGKVDPSSSFLKKTPSISLHQDT